MEPKQNKNYGTTYFALAFIVAVFFELYFIMTNPYNYFMLIGIGIIILITGYLTFDSIQKSKADSDKRLYEQNEMMIKASKAIYLATKRSTQEAEKQHIQSIKAIELMMNNMISNEKDMVNIMITKNEEIITKQIAAKPEENDMSSLIEQLSASNAKLAKEVQSAITVNELVKANADLVKNVREVLHGSQSSLNTDTLSEYISEAASAHINSGVTANNTNNTTLSNKPVDSANIPTDAGNDNYTSTDAKDIPVEHNTSSTLSDTKETAVSEINSPMEQEEDEFDFESFELPEEASEINIDENDTASSKEIIDDVNISTLNDMVDTEGQTIVPEVSEELDKEMSDNSSESIISGLDDNPNRQLTEEEIAALFANL